jgi:hypothetical protein
MPIETFGITPLVLKNRCANLEISDRTSPTLTAVNTIIEEAASEVLGEAARVGIASWQLDDPTYRILSQMTLYRSLSEVMAGRDRGAEQVTYFERAYDRQVVRLRSIPLALQPEGATTKRGKTVIFGDQTLPGIDRMGILRRILY